MALWLSILYFALLLYPPLHAQIRDPMQSMSNTLYYMDIEGALQSIIVLQFAAIILVVGNNSIGSLGQRAMKCILNHLLGIGLYHVIIYCFGALFFSKETLVLSMALSTMTVIPITNLTDRNGSGPTLLFTEDAGRYPRFQLFGTLTGAIIGSYLLPLDWFVPYQVFPLPTLLGLGCGHFIGSVIHFVYSSPSYLS